jgi:hypothetical protein
MFQLEFKDLSLVLLLRKFEPSIGVMTAKPDIEALVSLKLIGEIFLLGDKTMVGLEVLVNVFLRSFLDNGKTIDPSIVPIGLGDIFRIAECGHIEHKLFRLRHSVRAFGGLDRGGIAMDKLESGCGNAGKSQRNSCLNELPNAIWNLLTGNFVTRNLIRYFENGSIAIEWCGF